MTLAAGTRLGPYEVLGSLGAGGMGEVYRARDTDLGRDRFLGVLRDATVPPAPVNVVLNWFEELKRLTARN